jgi:hypothetical protein
MPKGYTNSSFASNERIGWPEIDLVLVDHAANDLSLRSSYVSEEVKEMIEAGQKADPRGWWAAERANAVATALQARARLRARRGLSPDSSAPPPASAPGMAGKPQAYHRSGQPVPGKPLPPVSQAVSGSGSDDDAWPGDEDAAGAAQAAEWRPLRLAVESLYR